MLLCVSIAMHIVMLIVKMWEFGSISESNFLGEYFVSITNVTFLFLRYNFLSIAYLFLLLHVISEIKNEYKDNTLLNLKEFLGCQHRGEDTIQKSLNPTKCLVGMLICRYLHHRMREL